MTDGPGPMVDGHLGRPGEQETAAALFHLLWETLADCMGAAAAATVVRRSARRAAGKATELTGLIVEREGFTYSYVLPPGWAEGGPKSVTALTVLVAELYQLLRELTGPVMIGRIDRLEALRRNGVLPDGVP